MDVHKVLNINKGKRDIISIVGAGGKTTIMQALAEEFAEEGKKVLVSTTTKLFAHQLEFCHRTFYGSIPEDYGPPRGSITGLGKEVLGDKALGMTLGELEDIYLRGIFHFILIEADGANMKPMKAHGLGEPVVGDFTTKTLGIIGLDSVGKPITDENIHRADVFSRLFGKSIGENLKEEIIVKFVVDKNGLFKNSHGERFLFLNKANTKSQIESGRKIIKLLKDLNFENAYITDIKGGKITLMK
ncbi:MAG: selenium cofactor biosynthesis protein YqeC [Tissierellaceae bacterium]